MGGYQEKQTPEQLQNKIKTITKQQQLEIVKLSFKKILKVPQRLHTQKINNYGVWISKLQSSNKG